MDIRIQGIIKEDLLPIRDDEREKSNLTPILKQATAPQQNTVLETEQLQRKVDHLPPSGKQKYDIQVKPANIDSGHNSSHSSSPSTSDQNIPNLESSKPRRPRSQFIRNNPTNQGKDSNHRFSYQNQDYHKQNIQVPNSTTVYRADMITYADLDPKAFMVPANKVLPSTMNGAFSDSSSKSTYAEISMSRSKLV